MNTTNPKYHGITLIEMMVALAITSFMILVVNQLFNEVVTTVRRGIQGGEILQRSRALNEQLDLETRLPTLDNVNFLDEQQWPGRMVGPAGREGAKGEEPGGFLVIVQREVAGVPLTLSDQIRQENSPFPIRSDQLMFIYDQKAKGDAEGRRLPTMTPSSNNSYSGEMINSIEADYVRIWYGHVLQIPNGQDPTSITLGAGGNFSNIDLGASVSGNPNAIAQDWVLGRQALFLTGSKPSVYLAGAPLPAPNIYASGFPSALNNVTGTSAGARLAHGLSDVSDWDQERIITDPGLGLNRIWANKPAYQGRLLGMAYAMVPLLTSTKPNESGLLTSEDIAPTHTYYMGGVSDFIVEFAGDLVNATFYEHNNNPALIGPDGELDRDLDGRIKWYTAVGANPVRVFDGPPDDPNRPVTYSVPNASLYRSNAATAAAAFGRADAAFVWRHYPSVEAQANDNTLDLRTFTKWPWMIRIRYRLHDRRGEFEGRTISVIDPITGNPTEVPEPGKWFEVIIPVNHQGKVPK